MKLLSVVSFTALAATSVHASIFEPAPYKLTDGFTLTPQYHTSVYQNDNIYSTESDKVSSMIYIMQPSVAFGTDDGINRYGGNYEITVGTYSEQEDGDDDYIDHDLSLLAHTEFTSRHRLDINLGFAREHDTRGSNTTESNAYTYSEPLEYNSYLSRAYYQFGSQAALMNIGGGLQYDREVYTNFTSESKYDDFETITAFFDGAYQIGDVTYLTADLSFADINYLYQDSSDDSQDNSDNSLYVGLRWEGLGKTVGTARFGYQLKSYDDSDRDDFNGSTVDIGVIWEPLQRSSFQLYVSRVAEDSTTDGDYVLTLSSSVVWNHNWTDVFDSRVTLMASNDDYVGSDSTREDDTLNLGLDLTYDLTRWLQITAGYAYTDLDSNLSGYSYKQNSFNLGMTFSL